MRLKRLFQNGLLDADSFAAPTGTGKRKQGETLHVCVCRDGRMRALWMEANGEPEAGRGRLSPSSLQGPTNNAFAAGDRSVGFILLDLAV